jgi:hypothetical protein
MCENDRKTCSEKCLQVSWSNSGTKSCSNRYGTNDFQKYQNKNCIQCKKAFTSRITRQKICSTECLYEYNKSEVYKAIGKDNGRKGGIASAAKQTRRSQAEILFADLCREHFGDDDIICNVPYFRDKNNNFWDADIIIKSERVAVCYNGIWHYKQVRKNHKLEQVQARDRLKQKIILDNGYTYYIVRDLGKFDKVFVKTEFDKFMHSFRWRAVMQDIIVKN